MWYSRLGQAAETAPCQMPPRHLLLALPSLPGSLRTPSGPPPTKVRPTCYSFRVFRARPAWGCWAEPALGACPQPGTRSHHARGGPWVSASNHRLARGWVCHRTMGRVRRNHEARAGAVTWASPEGTCHPSPPLLPHSPLPPRSLSVCLCVFIFQKINSRKGQGAKTKAQEIPV